MVTVLGISSLDLTKYDKRNLVVELGKTIGYVFEDYAFMLRNLKHESCAGIAKDQITFFISVEEDLDIDDKRKIIKLLNETMVREVGYRGEKKVIVIFRYRDSEGYSEGDRLAIDMK